MSSGFKTNQHVKAILGVGMGGIMTSHELIQGHPNDLGIFRGLDL